MHVGRFQFHGTLKKFKIRNRQKHPRHLLIVDYKNPDNGEKTNMIQHITAVHEEKKPIKCNYCDYSCSHKSNMNQHISRIHEGNHFSMKCVVHCSFPQKKNLTDHVV